LLMGRKLRVKKSEAQHFSYAKLLGQNPRLYIDF
jgi:hypothetical protein